MVNKILIIGKNGFLAKSLYELFKKDNKFDLYQTSSDFLNFLNKDQVNNFMENNSFDYMIFTPNYGRSNKSNDTEIIGKNINMYKNMIQHKDKFKLIFYFGSGLSFDSSKDINNFNNDKLGLSIPEDPYGYSKYFIENDIRNHDNIINLRLFNCFGIKESRNRMIKNNLINYINSQDIIIHQDRYFDFFYIEDLFKIIVEYIEKKYEKKEINCVYQNKLKLIDVANIINNLSDKKVNILIHDKNIGKSFNGEYNHKFNTIGLEKGIKFMYEELKNQINVAVIGTGKIGKDLIIKLNSLEFVNITAFVGRRKINKDELPDGMLHDNIILSDESINFFKKNKNICDVVIDCTSSLSAEENYKVFYSQNIITIDMTPSNLGNIYVPNVCKLNLDKLNINMGSCGTQVSLPIINYFYKKIKENLKYIEVVSQLSSNSAGLATRINISNYIETTNSIIKDVFNVSNSKVILNLNPHENTIMRTTVYIEVEEFKKNNYNFDDINQYFNEIKKYVKLLRIINFSIEKDLIWVNVEIRGDEYMSEQYGNLDVINISAIEAIKEIYNLKKDKKILKKNL